MEDLTSDIYDERVKALVDDAQAAGCKVSMESDCGVVYAVTIVSSGGQRWYQVACEPTGMFGYANVYNLREPARLRVLDAYTDCDLLAQRVLADAAAGL